MAESNDKKLPFVAFRFEIRVDELIASGGFSECTGLNLETLTEEYAEGGLNTHLHKFVGRTQQSNITLKRGFVDRNMHDWYTELVAGSIKRRNGTILVRDPSGGSVNMEWQFQRAFPCKWSGPELNAMQNNVAVETLELCHEGLIRRV